eukprot:CAMPEP_0172454712 /NCGR_PEP_ID=MMETSP1065-20121228/11627_1 /TAXON_ID=265537 /ORGANISM="Amphiprora paludosa, Strain CCMP125" /LENGTH=62 /DNA_ID=CAMNT_0013207091 /DNA_START=12 /DNA_END=197 /DNA_ORIENTATION=+
MNTYKQNSNRSLLGLCGAKSARRFSMGSVASVASSCNTTTNPGVEATPPMSHVHAGGNGEDD